MDEHRRNAEVFLDSHALGRFAMPGEAESGPSGAESGLVTKSALLPFRRLGQGIDVCLMQPVSGKPELGPALYEICKGTRMWRLPVGTWVDLKKEPYPTEGVAELLAVTALREAGEEMALPLESVVRVMDGGVQCFTSASTGKTKQMQLHLAEMREDTQVIAPDAESSGTESVAWFPLRAATEDTRIRPDHRAILAKLIRAQLI